MQEALNLNEKILELDVLPSLQPVASRLLEILSDDSSDIHEIEMLIQTDPALTARILKIVNSAYYGMRNIVDTVKLAIVILGFEEIRKIVTAVAFVNLSNEFLDNNDFDLKSFWMHSVSVAFFSEKLYKDFGIESHGEEFTSGLMHDIGKLAAGMIISNYSVSVNKAMKDYSFSSFEAEYLLYGTSHMEIGGFLAERWNFPDTIVNCIFSHHSVTEKTVLASIVELGNLIANLLETGNDINIIKETVSASQSWNVLMKSSGIKNKREFNGEYSEEFEKELQNIKVFLESLL